jgi:putative peptidoglycan binding protein
MNISHFVPGLIAVLFFAFPLSGFSKDRNRGDRDHDRRDSHDRRDWHDRSDNRHHFSGRNYRPYYRYGYPYSSYGYGYGYGYGYPYSGFGLSFSSRPYYSYYGSSSVYRGRPVSDYSDSLAADVQGELKRRGYYRGAIDGDIGPASRAAIRSYQAERGLPVTGRIDSSLLRSLGIG